MNPVGTKEQREELRRILDAANKIKMADYLRALDGLDIAEKAMLSQAVLNAVEPDHPWPEWYWHWRGVATKALDEALAVWGKWKGGTC